MPLIRTLCLTLIVIICACFDYINSKYVEVENIADETNIANKLDSIKTLKSINHYKNLVCERIAQEIPGTANYEHLQYCLERYMQFEQQERARFGNIVVMDLQ